MLVPFELRAPLHRDASGVPPCKIRVILATDGARIGARSTVKKKEARPGILAKTGAGAKGAKIEVGLNRPPRVSMPNPTTRIRARL